ncbi:MAG: tRNA 2-thiouridine(34) synthase MnmA [Candidatus Pacebacteria bacterium]|nr:tRNA 2-thiouridine(34) synthase MnmA [Candidatus Paceibacterota bacterium]MBP9842859.1 tRNA 2-thiouridine(34) synthase MnmA [Candidatus Paceibacterota bacterium]
MSEKQTVFVGLSGGVDSSVAALRLKKHGFNVVGVFIKVWHPDFMVCNWEAERLDAMRVAAHLDIPFLTCDAEAEYRDEVAQHFINEYKAGRTPNPDVLCNKEVKFGAFLRFAKERGADYVATGHYVKRVDTNYGAELHRGIDNNKDQSYFLWSLSNEQLNYALFPVGDSEKSVIRKEASQAGIPTATKKDSQGVCFLGHIDIPEFLSHYVTLQEGNVLDEAGTVIGTHRGALVYTIGQRHGFTLNNKDTDRKQLYVTAKDSEKNTITVSEEKPHITSTENISLGSITLRAPLNAGDIVEAQFRYRQTPFTITIATLTENTLTLRTNEEVERPAVGQSCVIYRGNHCIGGGTIL